MERKLGIGGKKTRNRWKENSEFHKENIDTKIKRSNIKIEVTLMNNDKVIKSNKLIQNKVTNFDTMQNKIMCVLISKFVNNVQNEFLNTSISIKELHEILGYTSDYGQTYKRIIDAIDGLANNDTIGMLEYNEKTKEKEYVWRHFFEKIKLTKDGCTFKWSNEMKPYLLELSEQYTQYFQREYLKLSSDKSQNLYEYLKSYENYKKVYHRNPVISIDEHYKIFSIDVKNNSYKSFKDFNKCVIKKCVSEINNCTDLFIDYKPIKQGKSVTAIEYIIKSKQQLETKQSKIDLYVIYKIGFDSDPTKADEKTLKTLLKTYDYSLLLKIIKQAKYKKAQTLGYLVNACKNTIDGIVTSSDDNSYIDPYKNHKEEAVNFINTWIDKNIDIYDKDDLIETLCEAYKYFTYEEIRLGVREVSAEHTAMTRKNIFDKLNNIVEIEMGYKE